MSKYRKELDDLSNSVAATGREHAIYLLGKIQDLQMLEDPKRTSVRDSTTYFGSRTAEDMIEVLSEYLAIEAARLADEPRPAAS